MLITVVYRMRIGDDYVTAEAACQMVDMIRTMEKKWEK